MRHSRTPEFSGLCIARWQAFAARCAAAGALPIQIFDAVFFQQTVRFLLEHEHAEGEALRYLKAIPGMIEFNGAYREACDDLLAEGAIPRIELDSQALDPETIRQEVTDALADWFCSSRASAKSA